VSRTRLDVLLVEQGLAESRTLAQRLVMAGQVRVDGQVVLKPATRVEASVQLSLDLGPRFVSRGGEKLDAALEHFGLPVDGLVCADVGASTGGFTDCLLQRGANKVYAIDVGQGILHWKLRQDKRVVVMEQTNARFVESLPEPVDLVTVDASFISLKLLLPVIAHWFHSGDSGQVVALIKPQFEAGRTQAARGQGVIRDPLLHAQILLDVLEYVQEQGYGLCDLMRSPLLGPKGNVEFLAWLAFPQPPCLTLQALVQQTLSG
jgi:23S rRNA (cytidine1920-2'-O)/16S rRNA (cytidine1409-2'-O)-methyltransferase